MHRQPTTMLTFRLDLYRVYTNTTTNERTISNIFHSKHRCLPHQIYAYLLACTSVTLNRVKFQSVGHFNLFYCATSQYE